MKAITSGAELDKLFQHARQLHSGAVGVMDDVETVWKGEFDTRSGIEDASIEVVEPSEGFTLLKKLLSLIAVRSEKGYHVPQRGDSMVEAKRADKKERFLRAYVDEHRDAIGSDVFRDAVFLTALRGRCPIRTLYMPEMDTYPQIRMEALDARYTFPVYNRDGILYYVTDKMVYKYDLLDYLLRLPEDLLRQFDPKMLENHTEFPTDYIRMVEYWDHERMAVGVFGMSGMKLVHEAVEHGYKYLAVREARMYGNPLKDNKWNCRPFLAPVINDIIQKARLESKLANGVEVNFFGINLIQDPNNGISRLNPYPTPGEFQGISPDAKITNFHPNIDAASLQQLYSIFKDKISKATLNDLAFAMDGAGSSGFQQQGILSILQDDLADIRDQIEQTFGAVLGDVLRLHEEFAPAEGWEYPLPVPDARGRMQMERIKAEDIGGNYKVKFTIKVNLPNDRVSKATNFNLLFQPGPDGRYRIDFDTALDITGLGDDIPDRTAMKKRIDWYFAKQMDPELQALDLARIKAEYADEIQEMRRTVEKADRKEEAREQRLIAKDIERGLSQDIIVPAEIESHPQFRQMLAQGMPLKQVVDTLAQGGLPMGVPGQPTPPAAGQDDPEMGQILQSLFGQGVQVAPESPDGFKGYGGIAPAVMPPAMQGALPRQVMDQDRLMVENIEEDQRRGGLPPKR